MIKIPPFECFYMKRANRQKKKLEWSLGLPACLVLIEYVSYRLSVLLRFGVETQFYYIFLYSLKLKF